MSRSRHKTPICGNTTAESDKNFKKCCHSSERTMLREYLKKADFEADPEPKIYDAGNVYSSDKDGKQYCGDLEKKNPNEYEKLMRK
jgi:hypothetical protein